MLCVCVDLVIVYIKQKYIALESDLWILWNSMYRYVESAESLIISDTAGYNFGSSSLNSYNRKGAT